MSNKEALEGKEKYPAIKKTREKLNEYLRSVSAKQMYENPEELNRIIEELKEAINNARDREE